MPFRTEAGRSRRTFRAKPCLFVLGARGGRAATRLSAVITPLSVDGAQRGIMGDRRGARSGLYSALGGGVFSGRSTRRTASGERERRRCTSAHISTRLRTSVHGTSAERQRTPTAAGGEKAATRQRARCPAVTWRRAEEIPPPTPDPGHPACEPSCSVNTAYITITSPCAYDHTAPHITLHHPPYYMTSHCIQPEEESLGCTAATSQGRFGVVTPDPVRRKEGFIRQHSNTDFSHWISIRPKAQWPALCAWTGALYRTRLTQALTASSYRLPGDRVYSNTMEIKRTSVQGPSPFSPRLGGLANQQRAFCSACYTLTC